MTTRSFVNTLLALLQPHLRKCRPDMIHVHGVS